MEKDDTTQLKTKLTQIKVGQPGADETRPRAKNEQVSGSVLVSDVTQVLAYADPLANAPTLANLVDNSSHSQKNSIFAQLDKRISEEYASNKVLKQRFVLTKTLGSGGMGNVYLAKDLLREEMEDSTPHVAIKVLNDECRQLPGALQALQSEAKKAQALSHPNIVTVYDFDRDGETAFITMEYIDGSALKDLIRSSNLPQQKAWFVVDRVARGLAYAHQQGFVHSDIKPANIFCADNGAVKILDFGIAKAFTAATKETRSLGDKLTEGALTPAYASLEMLKGLPPHPADDVYSLACMTYELLDGRHPFQGPGGRSLSAIDACDSGLTAKNIPGVSRRHMKAIRKGLAFKRANRFKDAGEFIDAIKPRSYKKEIALLAVATVVTVIIMFSGSKALDQVVPSVDSLKPSLSEVAKTILEADGFIETEDIDFAHRLYSQAWELANDLTVADPAERTKARSILSDRMGKISKILIARIDSESLDEFQLRELLVALEFMLKDEITKNDSDITKAILVIKNQLMKIDSDKNGDQ